MYRNKLNGVAVAMACCTSLIALNYANASESMLQSATAMMQPNSEASNKEVKHVYSHHPIDNNLNSKPPQQAVFEPSKLKVDSSLSALTTMSISAVATPTCDTNAYVTSGSALISAITQQGLLCINPFFSGASQSQLDGTFTEANIITIANEARTRGVSYNGVDTNDELASLHYWIRAFYYQGNRAKLTTANQAATRQAMDALFNNSHFYDKTEANASLIKLAAPNISGASVAQHYIGKVRDLLNRYDQSFEDVNNWGNAMAGISWDVLNECARQPSCRATEHTTTLINQISNYIHNNIDWLDHPDRDYHLHNLSYQLANIHSSKSDAHFSGIKSTLEARVNRIFTDFGYLKESVGRKAYMLAMSAVNFNQVCTTYNLCDKKDEIISAVLKDRITCPSGTLFMWAQDMNQAQREWACSSLGAHETYFHSTMQTNNTPVTPDDNDKLRMIVFNDSTEWKTYGNALFGAGTDNGGLYLEGDPSKAGDQATFFAYEDVPERPIFDIWNLRHEYMHYLDGRFNTKGDFRDINGAGKTVWYGEGIAEFISRKNCNTEAATQAAASTYDISTIFGNEYGVGQTRIYPWGYLAVRYMFEQQNATFFEMISKFRQGDYASYRSAMVDNWVNGQTFNNGFKSWLTNVTASGCTVDTTRPPSPIEPLNLDDVQGTDQVGINACVGGANREDNTLEPGVAVCLKDADNNGFVSLAVSVRSGVIADMQLTLRNGSGEADMLFRAGGHPNETKYDLSASSPGTDETILVKNVQPGWNYIRVTGKPSFSNVTALARFLPTDGTGGGNTSPTAKIDGPYTSDINSSISMSSNGSSDGDGSISTFSWNFGDGSALSTAANPNHTYTTAGTYTITLTVTDNDGASSSVTTTATIGGIVEPTYCTATGGGTYEWIAGVEIGGINNNSTQGNYVDYSNLTANLTLAANNITLTPGFTSGSYTEHWAVWIDYNNDGDFLDSGEQVVTGLSGKAAVTASITPPASAAGMTTRMRVAMKYNQAVTAACTNIASGEIEDYSVTIAGASNQAPTAVISGPFTGSVGTAVAMNSNGSIDPDGSITGYSWNFGDGSAISTSVNPTHTYVTAGTYNVSLTVTDDKGAKNTTTTIATINAVIDQSYCTVTGGGTYEWIAGVMVGGINNSSSQNNYTHYSNQTVKLTSAANSITLTPGFTSGSYTEHWAVWIDYNNDGDFLDNGEQVVTGLSSKSAVTASITPPASASGITTRMRVAMKYNQAVTAPCSNISSGEVEDYTVEIGGSAANQSPTAITDGPYSAAVAVSVSMSSNSSFDADGSIAAYSWNFGDGSAVSTSANPSHSYIAAGNYTVSLTVTDNDGATSTTTTTATITASGNGSSIENACATQGASNSQLLSDGIAACLAAGNSETAIKYLYINVPNGANTMTINMDHGIGDANIYYNAATWATETAHSQNSTNTGNNESIVVNNPASGYRFISVIGAHSGATLKVDIQ